MKQYPKCKNSKISWIGDVPEYWGIHKIREHFRERKEKVSDKDFAPLSVTKIGIVPQLEDACKTDNGDNRKLVRKGDFVVNSRSDRKGSCGISPLDGSVSLINIVLTPYKINSGFVHYLLRSNDYIEEFYRNGRGIVADLWTTRYSEMRNIFIPYPPADEQQAIVEFLDTAVDKIDRYIAAKEAEIEKLGTLKQSVISQAVTKGLNPAAPMKDSGIDWMNSIPQHWEIHSIKQHFGIQKRIAGKEGYNVFSITQNGLKVKDISQNDGQMAANYSGYQFVYPGDFAMNHMDLITGGVGLSTAFGVTSPDYRVFELFDNNNCYSEYYLRVFQICYWRRIFYRYGRGAASTGRWRLPAKAFLNFQIPVPSIKEQKEIVKYINEQIEKIDTSISNIRQQIAKLKVYKQRLISDAVTGKIDVRFTEKEY